jgi:glycerol-3-phosphate dehydrogenase (NAD(P)+)
MGTALGVLWAKAGHQVTLWSHDAELIPAMTAQKENFKYLPGCALPAALRLTDTLTDCYGDVVCTVVPTQFSRSVWEQMAGTFPQGVPLVNAAKGIEIATGQLLHEVMAQVLPQARGCMLSGPGFALEIAKGLPTAYVIASADSAQSQQLAELLSAPTFRLYHSADMIGTAIGGAVKNVIAIASGMVEGRGLGSNARAALVTRGLAEIARFNAALGGRNETMAGLAGVGDLMLTATSAQSRNYSLGIELGKGRTLTEILGARCTVSEGVYTVKACCKIAEEKNINMPICQTLDAVLEGRMDISAAISTLMNRPVKEESE